MEHCNVITADEMLLQVDNDFLVPESYSLTLVNAGYFDWIGL